MSGAAPRIHWVSPLPPAETDIAHYTGRILPELAARADLTLWTDAATWDAGLEAVCPVRRLDPRRIVPGQMRSPRLQGSQGAPVDRPGVLFVHIGNSWRFHAGLLALARRMPCVVVLHDLALQEMYHDAVHRGLMSRASYLDAMAHWHGAPGRAAARAALEGRQTPTGLGQAYPGFEIALDKAAAVLTHTEAATRAVAAHGHIPAYRLDLPFRASAHARADRPAAGPLRLVQFGHIGPNRRLEQVLEALAGMGDGFDFVLDIIGHVWNPGLIDARCAALGLSGKVRRHGYLPEASLDYALSRAHLVFNLRHPTMGEASGSQLRIWNAAAAAVVTDQGWYHDLPDDTVFRVPVGNDIAALQTLLGRLDADRRIGQPIGAAGRARLVARHGPAAYADGIVEVARGFEADIRDAGLAHAARRLLSRGSEGVDLKRRRLARLF